MFPVTLFGPSKTSMFFVCLGLNRAGFFLADTPYTIFFKHYYFTVETTRDRVRKRQFQNFYYIFCLSWSETCRSFLAGIKILSIFFSKFTKDPFSSETCAIKC